MEPAPHAYGGAMALYAVFLAIAALELIFPERAVSTPIGRRWFGNLSLHLASSGLFMLPVVAGLVAAMSAGAAQAGLLTWLAPPAAIRIALALLALDAMNYGLHRLSHAIAPLWRLHAVHHSDTEVDVTTTLRHHPIEALVAALSAAAVVFALGITPGEVAAYALIEWLVQSAAHANLALPPRWEAFARRVVVTPGFHQSHHCRDRARTDANYGQVLTIWDRLFRTASEPHVAAIEFGLDAFRDPKFDDAHWLLAQPLLARAASGASGAEASVRRGQEIGP